METTRAAKRAPITSYTAYLTNNFRLNKQCDTGGRPKYVVTKEQIETLRDTSWKMRVL